MRNSQISAIKSAVPESDDAGDHYYATAKHHSTAGTWRKLDAATLADAKAEANELFGMGQQDHLLCVGTARGDEPVRMLCNRLIGAGADDWQECNALR